MRPMRDATRALAGAAALLPAGYAREVVRTSVHTTELLL